MRTFELVVHDRVEEYDHVPSSLIPLADWWAAWQAGKAPFTLQPYAELDVRLSDATGTWLSEGFWDLQAMAPACQEVARRLRAGRIALLRSTTGETGCYLVFSEADPVRCVMAAMDDLPQERPFPFWPTPGRSETAEQVARFVAWAEEQAPRWLAGSGHAGRDRARGLNLRLPREQLIADFEAAAGIAAQVERSLVVVSRVGGPT